MKNRAEKIEIVSTSSLIRHPKNMHQHSKEQLERLAKLIDYQGWRVPLIVQKGTNYIVAGNGRHMVAEKQGIKEIPVIYQEFESEEQLYSFIVSDNAIGKDTWATLDLSAINLELENLGPDLDIDMLGLKDFVLEPAEKLDPKTDEDETPEIEHPITRPGDVWLLGNHKILCGDSTQVDDVNKLFADKKPDLVYSDPPYGVNIVSKQYGDGKKHGNGVTERGKFKEIKNDDTTDTARGFYQTCLALDFKKMIIWGANYFTDFLPPSRCWITWYKKENLPDDNFADSELAYCSEDKNCKVFSVAWKGMIKEGETGQKRVHPTQKPVMLAEKCFNYVGGKIVFDGFLGSGSTLIACEKTNRKCYGMELDEHYCDVIINRWQNFTGKEAILESTGETYNTLKETRDANA